METESIINGFLTEKELNDARMYSAIPGPTMWQKKQIIKLYIKLVTGVTFSGRFEETPDMEDFYQLAKKYFLYESRI